MKQRALTALQPTNTLHIGNLFGALLPMVEAQETHETLMFVVDYHAITVPQDPKELQDSMLFAMAAYLAAGIDPKKTLLFQQSRVSAHTEFAWILSTIAYMGELERMTQFKDKSQKHKKQGIPVGLFTYPILMASDILLYDINIVPIGEDQKQHLELSRNLAERFNNRFGDILTVPEPVIRTSGARIMSLTDGTSKMSKSASSAKSYISLGDEPDIIRKKIKSAVTDSGDAIEYDKKRPAISNLVELMHLATGKSFDEIKNEYNGGGYGAFKTDLAEAIIAYLEPIQSRMNELLADKAGLIKILDDGAERANEMANKKLVQIKDAMGITL